MGSWSKTQDLLQFVPNHSLDSRVRKRMMVFDYDVFVEYLMEGETMPGVSNDQDRYQYLQYMQNVTTIATRGYVKFLGLG